MLLTLSSSIGQTYFIGLFAGAVRDDLVLGHAGFGGIYTLATTASAACLLSLGKVADRVEPARWAALVMLLLAVAAMAMAYMVFATARAPGGGWLLDRGVEPQRLLLWLAGCALLCALRTLPLLRSLRQPRNKSRHRRPPHPIQREPTDQYA